MNKYLTTFNFTIYLSSQSGQLKQLKSKEKIFAPHFLQQERIRRQVNDICRNIHPMATIAAL